MQIWNRASAALGGIVWLALLGLALPGDPTQAQIARLLWLALLVIVPLGLALLAPPGAQRGATLCYRAALLLQPFGAALALLAFWLPRGLAAAALGLVWLLVCGLAALLGLLRLYARRSLRADELCIDAGLLYLPVGAIWLIINRSGISPLGFGDTIAMLTAAHFHYAGFAAPLLAGLAGRQIARTRPALWPLFRPLAICGIAGIALVAAGITLARFVALPEVLAAVLFAASMLALAVLTLLAVVRTLGSGWARALLAISSGALVITMLLAGGYAGGRFAGTTLIDIHWMVQLHGWLNALGFALCGLLAWNISAADKSIKEQKL